MNRSATNIPSACRIVNIALNDAMILSCDTNLGRMEFSERTGWNLRQGQANLRAQIAQQPVLHQIVPQYLPEYRRCAKVRPSRVMSQNSKNCNDGFPASRRTYWMAFKSCSSDCNCKPTLSERRSQVHGISQALTRLTWPPSRATARHRRSVPGHLMPLRSGAPHSTSPCARSAKTSQP